MHAACQETETALGILHTEGRAVSDGDHLVHTVILGADVNVYFTAFSVAEGEWHYVRTFAYTCSTSPVAEGEWHMSGPLFYSLKTAGCHTTSLVTSEVRGQILTDLGVYTFLMNIHEKLLLGV